MEASKNAEVEISKDTGRKTSRNIGKKICSDVEMETSRATEMEICRAARMETLRGECSLGIMPGTVSRQDGLWDVSSKPHFALRLLTFIRRLCVIDQRPATGRVYAHVRRCLLHLQKQWRVFWVKLTRKSYPKFFRVEWGIFDSATPVRVIFAPAVPGGGLLPPWLRERVYLP